jgi:hypothetical protein
MTVEQTLLARLKELPADKQLEVLDFAEFLHHRTGTALVQATRGPDGVAARRPAAELFADVRGRVKYHGDLLEPTTDEWPEV